MAHRYGFCVIALALVGQVTAYTPGLGAAMQSRASVVMKTSSEEAALMKKNAAKTVALVQLDNLKAPQELKDFLDSCVAENAEATTTLAHTTRTLAATQDEINRLTTELKSLTTKFMKRDAAATALSVKVSTLEMKLQAKDVLLEKYMTKVTSSSAQAAAAASEAASAKAALHDALAALEVSREEAKQADVALMKRDARATVLTVQADAKAARAAALEAQVLELGRQLSEKPQVASLPTLPTVPVQPPREIIIRPLAIFGGFSKAIASFKLMITSALGAFMKSFSAMFRPSKTTTAAAPEKLYVGKVVPSGVGSRELVPAAA